MAEKLKKKKFQWWWIIIAFVTLGLFAAYNSSKNELPEPQPTSTQYALYQDSTYGFSIQYPKAWEIRNDTQVFENGDLIAFGISGPTQKENTELTDGAQLAISKPFSINKDLATWAREYYDRYAEFSKRSINGRSFEKVNYCSRVGCMTYYYTLIKDQVYGLAVFPQGTDEDKMIYANAIVYMLKSLKFTNIKNQITSKEQAIAKVKALPEVIDYLRRVPNGLILVNGEDSNAYFTQVYELKNGHTATFNWYKVNKATGEITKEF